MKSISRFLLVALTLVSVGPARAVVATTAGSNLTAYNGASGAMNNNTWNTMMNTRGQNAANAPRADFGNCNALILRCAQPKCASGGCTTMEIATPIVSGCVQSNATCKQYGDELVEYISAQLVATSTARANAQAAAAQTAAAQAAAQQSSEQLQAMQAQMQELQQQNAETASALRDALAQQQEATATAIASAVASANQTPTATTSTTTATPDTTQSGNSATTTTATTISDTDLTAAQVAAANAGISPDILAREQISGQIMSKIENAENQLKTLKSAMDRTFEYAGCDTSGNNCTGPKRAKAFKQRAMEFFDPYNAVLDELYDALIMAQSVGVDITDIYMMLNGTCNAWAKYLCTDGQVMHYTTKNCKDGTSKPESNVSATVRGGAKCNIGQVVPTSDGGCQLIQMLTSNDEVQYNWLYPDQGFENAQVRVGCASEALDSSALFRNRKKQASIDIDTLQRIIEQDAPTVYGSSRLRGNMQPNPDGVKYCAVNEETLADLQKSVSLKKLPTKVCTTDTDLLNKFEQKGSVSFLSASQSRDFTLSASNSFSQAPSVTGNNCVSCNISSMGANNYGKCVTCTTGATLFGARGCWTAQNSCICPDGYNTDNSGACVRNTTEESTQSTTPGGGGNTNFSAVNGLRTAYVCSSDNDCIACVNAGGTWTNGLSRKCDCGIGKTYDETTKQCKWSTN